MALREHAHTGDLAGDVDSTTGSGRASPTVSTVQPSVLVVVAAARRVGLEPSAGD